MRELSVKFVDTQNVHTRPTNTQPVVSVPTKCKYRGEAILPQEAVRLGLGTVRRYYPCAAGRTMNVANVAGVVCSCKGCGPTCPDYRLKENGDEGE